jgi:hypothetical protein
MTILDSLHNDRTSVYELFEYGEFRPNEYEIANATKGQFYYMPRVLSYGDYDCSCHVERSNVRVFLEQFAGHPDVKKWTGWYGSVAVAIDILCEDEEIIDTLNSLADYPVIDDNDCSLMENEMTDEAWDSWIKSDFTRAIEKKFDAFGSEPDEDQLRELFHKLQEQANEYPIIESGGNVWINIEKLLEHLDEAPAFLNLEY